MVIVLHDGIFYRWRIINYCYVAFNDKEQKNKVKQMKEKRNILPNFIFRIGDHICFPWKIILAGLFLLIRLVFFIIYWKFPTICTRNDKKNIKITSVKKSLATNINYHGVGTEAALKEKYVTVRDECERVHLNRKQQFFFHRYWYIATELSGYVTDVCTSTFKITQTTHSASGPPPTRS